MLLRVMNEVLSLLMMIHHRLTIKVQHFLKKLQETRGFLVQKFNCLQTCVLIWFCIYDVSSIRAKNLFQ